MSTFALPAPRRAEKRRVKLKIGIQGASGSGKTDGALSLATQLVPGGRILLVDTENESASLYADRYEFDTIPLSAPYSTERYEAAIDAAVQGGYDVLILDSISHQWDGAGGILRRKEELDRRPNSNSFTNWAAFTPEHTRFVEKVKNAPLHVIATMRSKTEYILSANDKGKQTPKKVGTAPIQRDGFEYEFSLVFDVQMDHRVVAIKDRTNMFGDDPQDLRKPEVGNMLRNWLESAVEAPAQPQLVPAAVSSAAPAKTGDIHLVCDEEGILWCTPTNVQPAKSKSGAEITIVKLGGIFENKNSATCFHRSLSDALAAALHKPSGFRVSVKNGYINIDDVVMIGDIAYSDGQPMLPPDPTSTEQLVITDDDIPF